MSIHPTAVIDPGAEISDGVEIGPYAVIESDVFIGPGARIGHHAGIARFTRIGAETRVYPFASIGGEAQDLKYQGEEAWVEIGERTTIREYVTVNRGTADRGVTKVGDDCLLMAYSHVAHDCLVGDHSVLANAATLAGHVDIGDWVVIGGLSAVQQFVRLGEGVYLGGMSGAHKDVAPFTKAYGARVKLYGVNTVGMGRRGISPESISAVKQCYRLLFRDNLRLEEALGRIESEVEPFGEVKRLVHFMRTGERGFVRGDD